MSSGIGTATQTTKLTPSKVEEGKRLAKKLAFIINREVLAGNPHAIAILREALRS